MKKILLPVLVFLSLPLGANALPEHIYFRAMQDEMKRTMQDLRVKGSAAPFFVGYKLTHTQQHRVSASLGVALPQTEPNQTTSALVYVYAGDEKENSSGFISNARQSAEVPVASRAVPQSYEGIRRQLWRMTDVAYARAFTAFDQKKAYKKRKGLGSELPDFSPAKRAAFQQEITPFVPLEPAAQQTVNRLSEQGKKLPFLEKFIVRHSHLQSDYYFLDSEGDFAQYVVPLDLLQMVARFRGKEGEYYQVSRSYLLSHDKQIQSEQMQKQVTQFLQEIEEQYSAVREKKPYVGPVLFKKPAAASFFAFLFLPAASNTKPLLMGDDFVDDTAGYFRDRKSMRVISPLFDVYDRPQQRQYQQKFLPGFLPVDDEGVKSETLSLVKEGHLQQLPFIRSLTQGQQKSNGHARMTSLTLPRAGLTNLFFKARQSFSEEELEAKLLERCRELGLEYGYIVPASFSYNEVKGVAWPKFLQRIYTKDGRKENVTGLEITRISARALRNILAAGEEEDVFALVDQYNMGHTAAKAIIAPSVLVDEIELESNMQVPDTPPLVPIP